MATPDPEKIRRLQKVLAEWESRGSNSELFDYEREEALAPVRRRALRLLDQRARSEHELRQRLIQSEFPTALIDEVVVSLRASGLIDDRSFAHEWVRQKGPTQRKVKEFPRPGAEGKRRFRSGSAQRACTNKRRRPACGCRSACRKEGPRVERASGGVRGVHSCAAQSCRCAGTSRFPTRHVHADR